MTPSLPISRLFLITTLGLAACRATTEEIKPTWAPVVEARMGTMEICSYSEELWFGSTPSAADLELAQRRGFRRVIDLGCRAGADLAAVAAELGMAWEVIPVLAGDQLHDAQVDHVLELLRTKSEARTLMVCDDGGASAALFAIHRVVQAGMSLDEALVEARRSGLRWVPGARDVRAQVDRLAVDRVAP